MLKVFILIKTINSKLCTVCAFKRLQQLCVFIKRDVQTDNDV